MQAKALASEIEQIVRIYLRRSYRSPLKPAQWQALRFFAAAPRARLTDFARHQRATIGSVSMTVSQLVRRGYLRRSDPARRRNVGIELTDQGRYALAADPRREIEQKLQAFDPADRCEMHAHLARIRRTIDTVADS